MQPVLRWGVLGAARIAREQVIPAIRRAGGGEVVAVSSASGRAGSYAAEVGIARSYGSHEELLGDGAVDAVYIALPNSEHAAWIVRAADAGKHVLCEKPLVLGAAELDRVERARDAAGVQVVEAFMYRHHPQLAAVRGLLEDGTIGEIVAAHARLHFLLERTHDPDIRLRPDLGGGSLLDLGCYPVDFFGWLFGGQPDDVAAVAHRESRGGVDTRFAAVMRYGAAVATFDCGFDSPFLNTATIVGTRGTLTMPHVFRADLVGGRGVLAVDTDGGSRVVEVPGDQYAEEIRRFSERIRSGGGAEEDELSARTARTVERAAAAARQD